LSSIVKTEAIVLRSRKYRESSKMLTLYTKEFGTMTALLKGVRRASAKFPKAIDPLSYVSVVLYTKVNREVQTISQCDLNNTFPKIVEDLDKLSIALMMIELTTVSAHGHEKNLLLFTLLVEVLEALNHATKNLKNVLYTFEIGLAESLGYHPTFDRCISCGKLVPNIDSDVKIEYHLDKGGPLCNKCRAIQQGHKTNVSIRALQVLQELRNMGMSNMIEVEIAKELQQEVDTLLWSYLRYHVSGIVQLKSRRVFSEILTKV
jgi:DNA repair protein RecO (recombination protein O)